MSDYVNASKLRAENEAQEKQLNYLARTVEVPAVEGEKLRARIAELEGENSALIKLMEPHYASSEVIPENQLEVMLYDTITERNDLKTRITALETVTKKMRGVLEKCVYDLEASNNLRATDMTIEDFNDALARGIGRDCLEFVIDNSSSIRDARAALEKNNGNG